MKNKFGFTLIELLVVITIMGILATGGITVYTTQMQKARDSTRITDISALQSAIEQFNQEEAKYPVTSDDWTGTDGVVAFLPNLARDPRYDGNSVDDCNGTTCMYVYIAKKSAAGTNQGAYEISTGFENKGNVDSKAIRAGDGGDDNVRLERGYEIDASANPKGCNTVTGIDKQPNNTAISSVTSGAGPKTAVYRDNTGKPKVTTMP